jgi:hypothetical protein
MSQLAQGIGLGAYAARVAFHAAASATGSLARPDV